MTTKHASCCKLSIRLPARHRCADCRNACPSKTKDVLHIRIYRNRFCDDRSIDVQWLVAIIRLHHYPSLFRCEVWITWRDFGCPGVRRDSHLLVKSGRSALNIGSDIDQHAFYCQVGQGFVQTLPRVRSDIRNRIPPKSTA